jgi:hypothetical protein
LEDSDPLVLDFLGDFDPLVLDFLGDFDPLVESSHLVAILLEPEPEVEGALLLLEPDFDPL